MKTQMQKPVAGKASYTVEYKREALEHWKSSGRSAAKVAAERGIRARFWNRPRGSCLNS